MRFIVHRLGLMVRLCPSIAALYPENLVEAELFGSAKGAYTGSVSDRVGLCEEANNGTLFP